jgi:hypothetical protein
MSRSRTLAIAMSLLMVLSVVSATVSVAQPGPTEPTVEAASAATAQQVTAGGNVSRVAFDYGQFGGNLNIEVNGDRIENRLAVPKFRGGRALTDIIKLELAESVSIDTSRDIA